MAKSATKGAASTAHDMLMAARFNRKDNTADDIVELRRYASLGFRKNMSEEVRSEWIGFAQTAASQFRIVEKETADQIAKTAIAIEGLIIGLSALSSN